MQPTRKYPANDDYGILPLIFQGRLITGVEYDADPSQAHVLVSGNAGEQITEHIRRQTANLADLLEAHERIEELEIEVETLTEALRDFIEEPGQ